MRQRYLRGTGLTFCALGGLLILFVAYQLWGTSFSEHAAQGRLRAELEGQLHHRSPPVTAPASSTPSTSAADNPDTIGGPAADPSAGQPDEGQPIGFLTISRIGMNNSVIIQGTADPDLRQGPGHYPGSPLPGQPGNVAIAGHRTTYAAPFYNLNELQLGDPIVIRTLAGTFHYAVSNSTIVAPTDSSVLDNTSASELTLTTCNPRYSSSQRLIVVALLRSSQMAQSAKAAPARPGPQRKALAAPADVGGGDGGGSSGISGLVGWGLLTAVVGSLAVMVWRRWKRPLPRWVTVLVGVPASLIALFVFFGHLSTLLPASF